jgi:hypothetical protein
LQVRDSSGLKQTPLLAPKTPNYNADLPSTPGLTGPEGRSFLLWESERLQRQTKSYFP